MNSAWKIELSPGARKSLKRLDRRAARRVVTFLEQRVAAAPHPRVLGKPLTGDSLGGLWRYRVGHYRIVAELQDDTLIVLVVRIGHRSNIYR